MLPLKIFISKKTVGEKDRLTNWTVSKYPIQKCHCFAEQNKKKNKLHEPEYNTKTKQTEKYGVKKDRMIIMSDYCVIS